MGKFRLWAMLNFFLSVGVLCSTQQFMGLCVCFVIVGSSVHTFCTCAVEDQLRRGTGSSPALTASSICGHSVGSNPAHYWFLRDDDDFGLLE